MCQFLLKHNKYVSLVFFLCKCILAEFGVLQKTYPENIVGLPYNPPKTAYRYILMLFMCMLNK